VAAACDSRRTFLEGNATNDEHAHPVAYEQERKEHIPALAVLHDPLQIPDLAASGYGLMESLATAVRGLTSCSWLSSSPQQPMVPTVLVHAVLQMQRKQGTSLRTVGLRNEYSLLPVLCSHRLMP
jgi:hypothetical protein